MANEWPRTLLADIAPKSAVGLLKIVARCDVGECSARVANGYMTMDVVLVILLGTSISL